ncbi:MAG: hypothetical protein K8M05_35250 [Deltaproteobacteria bacterium]|nr:hypothetical protein [Kofleriaceae bacterium]
MKLSFAFAALLSLSLAACGGKSKPAETTGGGGDGAEEKVAADCCCDFIEETPIDESGEETAENQVYRMMTKAECDENSGQCGDAASCE